MLQPPFWAAVLFWRVSSREKGAVMRRQSLNAILAAVFLCALTAFAPAAKAVDLLQGAFVRGAQEYQFGYRSIPAIPVNGAPRDADWSRWAMLHDGQVYRLYVFRRGSRDEIYQFGFNRRTETYDWGYRSIPVLRLIGVPRNASTRSFAMLHDGRVYRLYLQDRRDPSLLHQFGFNRRTNDYEYGHQSIPQLRVTGFPRDTDWSRWAMLHDGQDFRFYAFRRNSGREVYQGAYDARDQRYKYRYRSIPVLMMRDFPRYANRSSMAMLHDGTDYRFYFKDR